MYYLILLTLCTLISSPIFANTACNSKPATLKAQVTELTQSFMQQYGIPGMAVIVYDAGTPYLIHVGHTGYDKQTPITENTLFEIGSISKVFTCLLIAQEVLNHTMQLDDAITMHIPCLKDKQKLKPVTLHQLATHTSSFPYNEPEHVHTQQDLLDYVAAWQPTKKDWWQYSNPGVELLRIALEDTTHESFNTLLHKNILQPLGMAPVGITIPTARQKDLTHCYDAQHKTAPYWQHPFLQGSAAMRASSADMLLFLQAALGLSSTPATIKKAMCLTQTPYVQVAQFKQGLGWDIHPLQALTKPVQYHEALHAHPIKPSEQIFNDDVLLEKTGTTNGFHAYIGVLPSHKIGIVIMMNHRLPPLGFTKNTAFGRKVLNTIKNSRH